MYSDNRQRAVNVLVLGLTSLLFGVGLMIPDIASASVRFEEIATSFAAGSSIKAQQLQQLGIYGSAVMVLLVLLNLVREKRGKKRIMALLAIQLLCNALLIYHIA